jgi:excisionase family DNA binding protein
MARRPVEVPALEKLFSLSVEDTCERTGWSKSQVYRELSSGGLKSYTIGRRRYVDAASLRARIAELVAGSEPIKPEPRFHRRNGPRG